MKRIIYFVILMIFTLSASIAESKTTSDNSTNNHNNSYSNIYNININGVITNATYSYVSENIHKSEKDNAILLITMDTPGGVLESTRLIVQSILSSKIPVVVYVSPEGARAASAGIFITMAAHFALMSESSNIGAAHPVNADGKDIKGDMANKVLNDTTALIRTISEKRGRNIDVAVGMVKDSKSYTANEALKLNIIDNVTSYNNLLPLLKSKYNLDDSVVITKVETTFLQEVYRIIANPNFLAAILFLGIVLIGLEIKMPGSFIFAGLGAACLIIFAVGANIIPINFFGILLILIGFGLLIAEMFITSFGLLTVAGLVSFLLGLRMLFDNDENSGVGVSIWVIALIIGLTLLIVLLIGRLIIKDFKRKPASGITSLSGEIAEVIEWKNNVGRVKVFDETWNAISNSSFEAGDNVKIVSSKGMKLIVTKFEDNN